MVEDSLLVWVSFIQINHNDLPTFTKTTQDLCDGQALLQLMHQVQFSNRHPQIFPVGGMGDFPAWTVKFGNLSLLLKSLEVYYSSELKMLNLKIFSSVDCMKIARFNDIPCLMNLVELVVAAMVKSPVKEKFIQRITGLNQQVQRDMMLIIKKSLQRVDSSERDIQQDIRQQKQQLLLHLEEFHQLLEENSRELDQLHSERDSLKQRLADLQTDFQSSQTKTPLDQNMIQLEHQLRNRDKKIRKKKQIISELKQKHLLQISSLKQELSLYKEQDQELSQVENQLAGYRKKLADLSLYKQRLKALQETNEALQGKVEEFQGCKLHQESLQNTIVQYKQKYLEQKEKVRELLGSLQEKDQQIDHLQTARDDLIQRKKALKAQAASLKYQLQRACPDSARFSDDSFSLTRGLQTDYQDQILRLEAVNKQLKDQLALRCKQFHQQIDWALLKKTEAQDQLELLQKQYQCQIDKQRDLEGQVEDIKRVNLKSAQSRAGQLDKLRHQIKNLQVQQQQFQEVKKQRDSLANDLTFVLKEKDTLKQSLFKGQEEIHRLQKQVCQMQNEWNQQEKVVQKLEKKLYQAKMKEKKALVEMELANKENKTEVLLQYQTKALKLEEENLKLKLKMKQPSEQLQEKREQIEFLKQSRADICGSLQKQIKLLASVIHNIGLDIMKYNQTHKEKLFTH